MKSFFYSRSEGLVSMKTRSISKVVVGKMPETFNSSKKRNKGEKNRQFVLSFAAM